MQKRFSKPIVGVLLLVIMTLSYKTANATTIEVFVTQDQLSLVDDKHTYPTTVYQVDGFERFKQSIQHTDPQQLKQSLRYQQAELAHLGKGLEKKMRYQITHTPAYVFDGQQVIYGGNLFNAIREYQRWQQAH